MKIDPESPDWPYQQVAARLRAEITSGRLGPRLPSHMKLAEQLGVATKTVQRAMRLLKEEGLVYTVPGRGSYAR